MEHLASYEDNHFDLAIVDPPYGIKADSHVNNKSRTKLAKTKDYHKALWYQDIPSKEYFEQLFRISKNQIVWGANHFIQNMPKGSPCWIVWDKDNQGTDFADAELAWTSFRAAVRIFKYRWNGMLQKNMKRKEVRIHPTQKPVDLYKWLLHNYAKQGDKILDTHLGSGSIAIACHDYKFDFTGYEIDRVYFDLAKKRIDKHQRELQIDFNENTRDIQAEPGLLFNAD